MHQTILLLVVVFLASVCNVHAGNLWTLRTVSNPISSAVTVDLGTLNATTGDFTSSGFSPVVQRFVGLVGPAGYPGFAVFATSQQTMSTMLPYTVHALDIIDTSAELSFTFNFTATALHDIQVVPLDDGPGIYLLYVNTAEDDFYLSLLKNNKLTQVAKFTPPINSYISLVSNGYITGPNGKYYAVFSSYSNGLFMSIMVIVDLVTGAVSTAPINFNIGVDPTVLVGPSGVNITETGQTLMVLGNVNPNYSYYNGGCTGGYFDPGSLTSASCKAETQVSIAAGAGSASTLYALITPLLPNYSSGYAAGSNSAGPTSGGLSTELYGQQLSSLAIMTNAFNPASGCPDTIIPGPQIIPSTFQYSVNGLAYF